MKYRPDVHIDRYDLLEENVILREEALSLLSAGRVMDFAVHLSEWPKLGEEAVHVLREHERLDLVLERPDIFSLLTTEDFEDIAGAGLIDMLHNRLDLFGTLSSQAASNLIEAGYIWVVLRNADQFADFPRDEMLEKSGKLFFNFQIGDTDQLEVFGAIVGWDRLYERTAKFTQESAFIAAHFDQAAQQAFVAECREEDEIRTVLWLSIFSDYYSSSDIALEMLQTRIGQFDFPSFVRRLRYSPNGYFDDRVFTTVLDLHEAGEIEGYDLQDIVDHVGDMSVANVKRAIRHDVLNQWSLKAERLSPEAQAEYNVYPQPKKEREVYDYKKGAKKRKRYIGESARELTRQLEHAQQQQRFELYDEKMQAGDFEWLLKDGVHVPIEDVQYIRTRITEFVDQQPELLTHHALAVLDADDLMAAWLRVPEDTERQRHRMVSRQLASYMTLEHVDGEMHALDMRQSYHSLLAGRSIDRTEIRRRFLKISKRYQSGELETEARNERYTADIYSYEPAKLDLSGELPYYADTIAAQIPLYTGITAEEAERILEFNISPEIRLPIYTSMKAYTPEARRVLYDATFGEDSTATAAEQVHALLGIADVFETGEEAVAFFADEWNEVQGKWLSMNVDARNQLRTVTKQKGDYKTLSMLVDVFGFDPQIEQDGLNEKLERMLQVRPTAAAHLAELAMKTGRSVDVKVQAQITARAAAETRKREHRETRELSAQGQYMHEVVTEFYADIHMHADLVKVKEQCETTGRDLGFAHMLRLNEMLQRVEARLQVTSELVKELVLYAIATEAKERRVAMPNVRGIEVVPGTVLEQELYQYGTTEEILDYILEARLAFNPDPKKSWHYEWVEVCDRALELWSSDSMHVQALDTVISYEHGSGSVFNHAGGMARVYPKVIEKVLNVRADQQSLDQLIEGSALFLRPEVLQRLQSRESLYKDIMRQADNIAAAY